jgi:hypothetical protein
MPDPIMCSIELKNHANPLVGYVSFYHLPRIGEALSFIGLGESEVRNTYGTNNFIVKHVRHSAGMEADSSAVQRVTITVDIEVSGGWRDAA